MWTGRAEALTLTEKILTEYNAEIKYDEVSKTMVGTIKVTANQANADEYIFPAGTYDFYYDNTDTLREKLELINKYNLKGSGSWALGQDIPEFWDDTSMWITDNAKPVLSTEVVNENEIKNSNEILIFEDVKEESWSKQYIDYAYSTKLMIGKTTNYFGSSDSLTRAETVTIISRLLDMNNIVLPEQEKNISFNDIENHCAYNDILKCVNLGLIIGYDDGTFKPDKTISREEIVTILSRMNLDISQKENDIIFTDVNEEKWSYNSIISLAQRGILTGYADNTFRPTNDITREEMATILYKICDELE